MKKSAIFSLLLIFALLPLCGCSEKVALSNLYFSPEWMSDGRILCVRGIRTEKYNNLGIKAYDVYKEFLCRMYSDGSAEVVGDEITLDVVSNPTCSPTGNMLAYASGLGGGEFPTIVVRYYPPTSEARADRIEISVPHATSFDWDNTGSGFFYSNAAGEIRHISLTGTDTLVLAAASVKSVAAKYGARIAFTYVDGTVTKVSLVNTDGTNRVNTGVESFSNLCISKANTNEVYGVKGTNYAKLNTDTLVESTVITGISGNNPRLAPSGDKVVLDKDNSLYTQAWGGTAVKIK